MCVCVWGGSSEATQSLVLRHCIPAGRLPVPDAFLPQSHRGDCLGIWPHILQIQGKIWQKSPPFSSLPFYLAQGKPYDLPALLPREG